ncbi:protein kinase subdomain-containing protein PKL/CAK/Fmp29 [Guyanagaster necrorhizus]|uniref:Protein kinase subdomain-containing protein PKL/CAK/Fmp29 n=1 Tax=Guyanagaster necrorhizus TaxID=856835 RepID=A0A9P7VIB8_9AGAR|nr:protein kinase subdomain-containing protein PKL/CAK/Fmp29 [Guyanagaster necrorhizus MCA 3950]KAG7441085.1 protein kinase subdomain-containing protein PKL/CAK/Fmp29 [Guyanagaster necrorhizus MCA 3950]
MPSHGRIRPCSSINDALRLAERRRVFNVDGLCRLAAESVGRSLDDIVDLAKLAEGGFNRTFLITMHGDFQMVARIPYPIMVPKYYAIASEVATMALLRSSGLPIPEVYGYSPTSDNAAGTEYIFMEFVQGTKLSDVWLNLGEREISSVLRQLAQLESKMMSIAFPAGGSLYYAEDLKKVAGEAGIPLEDARFCVGPDTRLPLWYGRRSQLDVDRGPYKSAEATLARAAHKERTYLERFGQPLLPFERVRREGYQYQEQPPSDHIENLDRYLLIALSLVPRNPALRHFCIRHPDLHPSNIIVSTSPDSKWQVVGLLDWQHAPILPPFLLAGVPQRLQNYDDPISQAMTRPSLPENLEDLDKAEQIREKELYHRRLVHYHYVKSTEKYNELHYAALTDPAGVLRRRLFHHASEPWEGETLALKVALMDATANWEALTGGGAPCPVAFDAEDVRETKKLDGVQSGADEVMEALRNMIGYGPEGWVPTKRYEEVMTRSKQLKEGALAAAESAKERAEMATHWPLDDMDEEKYM